MEQPNVRQRAQFLRQRLMVLAERIEQSSRDNEIAELSTRLAEGNPLPRVPSDAEWDLLLPAEQTQHLPSYYLSLRAELLLIDQEGLQARQAGRLKEFLDGPVPKLAAFGAAAAKLGELFVVYGPDVLRSFGLGYTSSSDGSDEGIS